MSIVRNWYFNLEDASQIAIGSFALAVPISFSEEAWRLSETLPTLNLVIIFTISIGFLAMFTYGSVFQANIKHRYPVFLFRIIVAYVIAILVVALVLWSLDKFPILVDTITSIKRLIVIAMPASMGAIIVDALDKE